MEIFQLQMLQEAKERREDRRDKAEERNAMMQLVTSVVAGIGSSVASYLESKVPSPSSLPIFKPKKKKRRVLEVDSSSDDSDSENDDEVVGRVYRSVRELNEDAHTREQDLRDIARRQGRIKKRRTPD